MLARQSDEGGGACRVFRITLNVTSGCTDVLSIERKGCVAMCVDAGTDVLQGTPASSAWRLSFVAVMQAADFRSRDDWLSGRCRDRPRIWRVLLEPEMGSSPMIVPAVAREDAS